MRLRFEALVMSLALSFGVSVLSAQAQFSDAQVGALVEALRQAAPPNSPNDGLYSEWQIKPENIPRWSRFCTGRSLTPAQFEADPAAARSILVCIVRDVLKEEYPASNGDAAIAVRRAAAWWMTGDANRYNSGDIATYTQRVLNFYQKNQGAAPTRQSAAPAGQKPTPAPIASQPRSQSTPYDRYMRAGYAATQQKDYAAALIHFQRALDERPADNFATQAVRNVENYLKRDRSGTLVPTPAASPAATPPASPATGSPATTPPKTPTITVPIVQVPASPPVIAAPPPSKPTITPISSVPAAVTSPPPIAASPASMPSSIPTVTVPLTPPTTSVPTTPSITPAASLPSAPPAGSPPAAPVPIAPASAQPTLGTGAPIAAVSGTTITENQAVDLIKQWLQAKEQIFAPPFAQKPIADLTTGELYASLLKPDGVLDWLKQRQAYYRYGVQKVEAINRFASSSDRATIEITLTEERTLYRSGVIDPQQTAFATKQVRFSLERADGRWKIADYKTIDGSLLERAVLGSPTTAEQ